MRIGQFVIASALVLLLSLSVSASPLRLDDLFNNELLRVVVGEEAEKSDFFAAMQLLRTIHALIGKQQNIAYERAGFSTPADLLEYNEPLGKVRPAFTKLDLPTLLATGNITTPERQTLYNQYLRFNDSNMTDILGKVSGSVIYGENDENAVGSYLFFNNGQEVFEWMVEFEEGLRSKIAGDDLESLEDRELFLLGEYFTVADTAFRNATNSLEVRLMSGETRFLLHENEQGLYAIGPKRYVVTVLTISETAPEGAVKLKINGEITGELTDGDFEQLEDGTFLGITNVLPSTKNIQSGIVMGYLGARTITLLDSNILDDGFQDSGVKINGESIYSGLLRIRADQDNPDTFMVRDITYRLLAWSNGTNIYVPKGGNLRGYLPQPEAMLTGTWDITYPGEAHLREKALSITPATYLPIAWNAPTQSTYKLNFTNQEGYSYEFPHVTNEFDVFSFGDGTRALHFKEPENSSIFPIMRTERFVVSDASIVNNRDDNVRTRIIEYSSFDALSRSATFVDLGVYPTRTTYETQKPSVDTTGRGTLLAGGRLVTFFVDPSTNSSPNIVVDLNIDGDINSSDEAILAVRGNGLIDLGEYNSSNASYTTVIGTEPTNITMVTLAKRFKNPAQNENITFSIEPRASKRIGIVDFPQMAGGTGYFSGRLNDPQFPDLQRGSTGYGVKIEFTKPAGVTSETLTFQYPVSSERAFRSRQVGQQIFITAAIPVRRAFRIAAAELVLESDAENTTTPLVVIGGPCANRITATLLNVSDEECTQGFVPGAPLIELREYGSLPVLVLAGFDKEDTLAAVERFTGQLEGTRPPVPALKASPLTGLAIEPTSAADGTILLLALGILGILGLTLLVAHHHFRNP